MPKMSNLSTYIDLIDKNTLHNVVTKLKSQGDFDVCCDVEGTHLTMREYYRDTEGGQNPTPQYPDTIGTKYISEK